MMKSLKIILFIVVTMTIMTAGCGVVKQIQSRSTNEKFMQIQIGMDRDQVLSILGNPYRREVYGDSEYLIYETDHAAGFSTNSGRASEGEQFTPILFKNGKVVGWGRNYYDKAIRSKIDADIRINTK